MMRAIFPYDDEERLKDEFFSNVEVGFFVEVGASRPIDKSQTFRMEKRGWKGVLIEPQPELAAWLRRDRSVPVYAVACSSRANAGRTMPLLVGAWAHASLNSDYYIPGHKGRKFQTVDVPVTTVDDILLGVGAPAPIDFISIDVEFHEMEVLDGFDIARWRPRLILIEDVPADLQIHRYLRRRGYKWVRRTGVNSWYVPDQTPMAVSLFGRWQFIRKHVLGVPIRRLRDAKRRWRQQ
jgi:FkbM family methyltransferase